MNSLNEAMGIVFAMGAVILFCRAFPFLFFSRLSTKENPNEADPLAVKKGANRTRAVLNFVEKVVPPAAMTVLAFNALGTPFLENTRDGILVLAASVFTALIHLWKRNSLLSIFGGTALYMILIKL